MESAESVKPRANHSRATSLAAWRLIVACRSWDKSVKHETSLQFLRHKTPLCAKETLMTRRKRFPVSLFPSGCACHQPNSRAPTTFFRFFSVPKPSTSSTGPQLHACCKRFTQRSRMTCDEHVPLEETSLKSSASGTLALWSKHE